MGLNCTFFTKKTRFPANSFTKTFQLSFGRGETNFSLMSSQQKISILNDFHSFFLFSSPLPKKQNSSGAALGVTFLARSKQSGKHSARNLPTESQVKHSLFSFDPGAPEGVRKSVSRVKKKRPEVAPLQRKTLP